MKQGRKAVPDPLGRGRSGTADRRTVSRFAGSPSGPSAGAEGRRRDPAPRIDRGNDRGRGPCPLLPVKG